MTDVLLVGGGGREHSLAWKLAQSPGLGRLVAAPGNPGIAAHARCVPVKDTAIDDLVALAQRERPDLVVVGPETPLAMGLADRLRAAGFAVFGGGAAAARLESSKAFAKDLMARHRIPTARFGTFRDLESARAYCRELGAPLVVKADGLAAGKGVIICRSLEEADAALAQCLQARAFGDSGLTVVVEEFLEGEEASFFAISDGTAVLPLAAAQDHKTVWDGDRGPNTGGMGAYSPAPVLDSAMEARVMAEIVRPTIAAMAGEGTPYTGVLYVGLMITREGPKVIEFNCRFGDPECQVLLPRLDEDLLALLLAAATGKGLPSSLAWSPRASVCV
ncbi:MAG TPA: phosphoribosylamine--glycine ligase, partial [Verrucomicrobiae bacterium]|nr:phosphoribosylamine--glycine ligase [Verrucomicrobiae bacterium]